MTEKMSLTRALVDRLPASIEDPGPIAGETELIQDGYYERTAKDVLKALPKDGALWVFAFGSLIWKPRFADCERRKAHITGWHRDFCLGPDTRYRGNPEAPGLMLSLAEGGSCEGLVLRVAPQIRDSELLQLISAEPPAPPIWLDAQTPQGRVRCIAFACPTDFAAYEGGLSADQIARRLSRAVGMFGSMPDYLLNTIEHLQQAGIHDPYLWQMQERVAHLLEAFPPKGAGSGAPPRSAAPT